MTNKPNLMRVAVELSGYGAAAYPVADAMLNMLAAERHMSNNERFNLMLNSCKHPRQVYNALSAFPKEVTV